MNKLPDAAAAPSSATTGERPAIKPSRKRSTGWLSGTGLAPLLMAVIAAWFSLNALAADTTTVAGAESAVTPSSDFKQREEIRAHWEKMSPEERKQIRARLQEHWKTMSPEQREESRKEMREHFKNMSPQERQQFKSDMDMIDGMSPPGSGIHGSKADAAARSTKG